MKNNIIQSDYTPYEEGYQLCIPLEIGILIPADDSVRLLNAVMERMDYRELYDAYSPYGRDGTSPKALFKVLVYGYMNGLYSSRGIERACRRDVNFMYLLGGAKAPDHNTIARFRTKRLDADIMNGLFEQFTMLSAGIGELSCENIFIDGTKSEAFPNRYKFVWKKSVEKQSAEMQKKMKKELPGLAADAGVEFEPAGDTISKDALSRFIATLRREKKRLGVEFVSGTGKRKTAPQKLTEAAEGYLARMRRYENDLRIMGDRNSYAKTDHDATFMRMKEDHMRNGQLKPAYNIAIGADAEYISSVAVFQDRNDSGTLIPFMKRLEKTIRYKNVVTDAGYESEENYSFLDAAGYSAFIKPSNYETSKTKKYRTDIGLRVNMLYDKDADIYICHAGYPLENVGIKKSKSKSGYPIETTIYECKDCAGCALKEKCIKPGGKLPIDARNKRLHVSKNFLAQRERSLQRITSDQGILLRVNRSIQSEGTFGVLKQDMGSGRFLLRSKVKVQIEISLLCLAYNVKKLHNKIQSDRCGMYLHFPKVA